MTEFGESGPVGTGVSSDYETKALDILNDGSESEGEANEPSTSEPTDTPEPTGEPESETGEIQPEAEEVPEEPAEEVSEPEEDQPKDTDLTLSGKEAYDKLKKEFPDALRSNPALRQVFFREKAFSDIYASVDEARSAANNSEFLEGLSLALNNGNIKAVVGSLSEKARENLAEQFINVLPDIDRNLFVKATGPLISNILNDAFEYGRDRSDKNLQNAVLYVSRFLTGKFELPKRTIERPIDSKLIAERQQFEQEKQTFINNQTSAFLGSADRAVETGLSKYLLDGLDPEGNMSQFVKNAIIKECIQEVKDYVSKDQAFNGTLNEMFRRAQRAGFDGDSKSRMISAYLGRVKDIALKIRARKKSEATKSTRSTPERNPIRKPVSRTYGNTTEKKQLTELDVIRAR